jgi:hypothetical protein
MQSAAGGTSQRLKPAVAIVRSLSRMPGAPDGANVVSAVVIGIRLQVRDLDGPRFSKIEDIGLRGGSFRCLHQISADSITCTSQRGVHDRSEL